MKFFIICSMLFSSLCFAQTEATQKLFQAIKKNDLSKAREAIQEGADINGVNDSKAPTTTMLVKAVKLNRLEIVKLLLENNANVNQRKPIDLYSGLMVAAKYNFAPIAKLLIDNGADVNQYSVMMRTSLYIAALHNSLSVAKLLVLSDEINTNFSNIAGLCPISVASRQNNKEIVRLLKNLESAKAPSHKCLNSAIRFAESNGHTEIVNILKGH